MYEDFRVAILRIMYDVVNADGVVDDVEIYKLEELKKKYGIISKDGIENMDLIIKSNKITFADAVNMLRKWQAKEVELIEVEGLSEKYNTKAFMEDINSLAEIDGDCSANEAYLILALKYMLSGDEDEVRMLSCKVRNLKFSRKEILYVESDRDERCNAELERKERLKEIVSVTKLYGFDFVYIPDVVSFLAQKHQQEILYKIMMFVNPLFLQKQDVAMQFSKQLTLTRTEDFVKYYLSEHGERPDIVPSLMLKVCSSLKLSDKNDGKVQGREEYIDFLLISIDRDVSSTVQAFLDEYILLAKRLRHPVELYAKNRIRSRGFHKTMLDFVVYKSMNPQVNRVILDFSTKSLVFEGLGLECHLPPVQLLIYALIVIKSNSCYGCFKQKSVHADKDVIDSQLKEYRMLSRNSTADLYYNLSSYISKIKSSLSQVVNLQNKELYMPRTADNEIHIKAPIELFYVKERNCDAVPIEEWFESKTNGGN